MFISLALYRHGPGQLVAQRLNHRAQRAQMQGRHAASVRKRYRVRAEAASRCSYGQQAISILPGTA